MRLPSLRPAKLPPICLFARSLWPRRSTVSAPKRLNAAAGGLYLMMKYHTVLQDPNVTSSPVENKLSFLRSKNLTQEEIDVSLTRVGIAPSSQTAAAPSQVVAAPVQQQPYYNSYPPTTSHGWQPPPPPPPPKRDWRDWFIMATVVGGVGYGLYSISKVLTPE